MIIRYLYQSGLKSNHSTDLFLIFLHDKILKSFDNGLYTGMTLIDLQKGFDTKNHKILLDNILQWLFKAILFKVSKQNDVSPLLYSNVFRRNVQPMWMNEVFRQAETIRINMRNSYLKLNHPFRKTKKASITLNLTLRPSG